MQVGDKITMVDNVPLVDLETFLVRGLFNFYSSLLIHYCSTIPRGGGGGGGGGGEGVTNDNEMMGMEWNSLTYDYDDWWKNMASPCDGGGGDGSGSGNGGEGDYDVDGSGSGSGGNVDLGELTMNFVKECANAKSTDDKSLYLTQLIQLLKG